MDGTCSVTADDAVQTYTYEQGLLRTSTILPLDYRSTYLYDGPRLASIERIARGEREFRREFRYDATGHLESVTTLSGPDDVAALEGSQQRTFEYDAAGRLARIADASRGQTTNVCSFEYDTEGRLASYTCEVPGVEEEGGPNRTSFGYDAAGRIAEERTRESRHRRRYDASGREEGDDMLSESGEVIATLTRVRDARGREIERRATSRRGRPWSEVVTFQGTFGDGAECGGVDALPPGVPEEATFAWFVDNP